MKRFYLFIFLLLPALTVAQEASLTRVVDGDTVVATVNGVEEKVRIIGINTPEAVDPRRPVECFGKEASAHAKKILNGETIVLENATARDKHGRLLAYIKLPNGNDFGAQMISDGYAYAYRTYSHDRMSTYIKLEKQSRKQGLGLWNENECLYEPETQELIIREKYEFWKSIFKIIREILQLIF